MSLDLVIDGKFLIDGELKQTSVGIEGGRIATIGNIVRGGDEHIDLGSKLVLPGFVDPHVHFRDPGMTQKEDFTSGTMSALFGGVTCVFDMPNTKPPTVDVPTIMQKKTHCSYNAYTDYGLFAALTRDADILSMAPHVIGYKLFMGSTTGNILMNDDEEISYLMGDIARTGKVLSVHAEDDDMIGAETEYGNWDHLKNRPVEAELNAIRRLGRYKGMKINICHATCAGSIRDASSHGFTTEVTMHHMMFAAEDVQGTEYKVNPPIRDRMVRNGLCIAVSEGKVTMIGSDHAPHTQEEKSQEYAAAPGGMIGVETTVPMLLEWCMRGRFSLPLLARMGAENPGRVFGLNKGRIAVGYDADFSVFDVHNVRTIDVDLLHSKAGHTAYEGKDAIFPDTVIVRGNIQIQGGEFCGETVGEDVVEHI